MKNILVTPKSGGVASTVTGQDVKLFTPSLVKLELNKSDIKSLVRSNNDLVITTKTGEVVVIHHFYDTHSDLVLQDDKGALYWMEDPGTGNHLVSIDSMADLIAEDTLSDGAVAALGFGGAALAGIAAMLVGSSHHSGDSSNDENNATSPTGSENKNKEAGNENKTTPENNISSVMDSSTSNSPSTQTGTDTTGNTSPATSVSAPDTTAPAPISAGSLIVSEDGKTVSGSGEPGSTVSVKDAGGKEIGTATVGKDGKFSATLDQPKTGGEVLSVTQTDMAGNTSPATSVSAPDTTAPAPISAGSLIVSEDGKTVSGS
ncbi:Ig-like domain-containing protein, partial [Serratia sp. IR-2025]